MDWQEVIRRTSSAYATLGNPLKALVRDVNSLAALALGRHPKPAIDGHLKPGHRG